MADGPELVVKYKADLSDLKRGSTEVKKEVASLSPEVQKSTKSLNSLEKEAKVASARLQSLADVTEKYAGSGKAFQDTTDKISDSLKKSVNQTDSASSSIGGLGDIADKASMVMGGKFVTAALAIGVAIFEANNQVEELNASVLNSSGSQEKYAANMANLEGVADKYRLSIFELAGGFTELTRETRGTINEGAETSEIFDTLVAVAERLDSTVEDTTGTFTGFIDKMKEGTVDSTNLSSELEKRLYEAFTNVAEKMGVTNEELNEVLKTSDDAVARTLPALAGELENTLGDDMQNNARDLGDSVGYAYSKLTLLLAELFHTSKVKSVFARASDDLGDFFGRVKDIAKEKGTLAAIVAGGATLTSPILAMAYDVTRPAAGISKNKPGTAGGSKVAAAADAETLKLVEANRLKEEEKANKKRIAEAKRLANERKRAADEVTRQEIEDSKRRIRDGIMASEAALDIAYGKNNGVLGAMSPLAKRGIDYGLDNDLKGTKKFSNESKGDGKSTNFDEVSKGVDALISEVEAKYDQMQAAIKGGMQDELDQLNEAVGQALANFAADMGVGIGEAIGTAIATGGESLGEAGKKFGLMLAGMLSDLGKALIAVATLKIAASKLFSTPGGAVAAFAVGVAAVAAGAYLQSKMTESGQKLYTGGVVRGPAGVDNVPIWASPGELMINQGQQNNLMRLLDSGPSMRNMSQPYGGYGGGSNQQLSGRLTAELRGSTLALAVDLGRQNNAYFGG